MFKCTINRSSMLRTIHTNLDVCFIDVYVFFVYKYVIIFVGVVAIIFYGSNGEWP